jgi:two-component system, OmpR family, response regulator VanR
MTAIPRWRNWRSTTTTRWSWTGDLPGTSGDEVCRAIAGQRLPVKVLMLTAARRLDQKVAGFELGADYYLTKPFELPELIARLRALARRPGEGVPRY